MTNYKISKPADRNEWLATRWATPDGEKRITASNAAIVHDQHKFKTPADYATELLAPTPPAEGEQNDAMMRGTRMEPLLRKWASDLVGTTIIEPTELYCYDDQGARLLATIDGTDDAGKVYEIKTYRGYFDGALPDYWYWQGVHQAICADVSEIVWIIFDSALDLILFTQTVTSDEKQVHIDACSRFLTAIDLGMLPEGIDYTYSHIYRQNPVGEKDKKMELPAEMRDVLTRLENAKLAAKNSKQVEEECKATICTILGDSEIGIIDGETVCTWKTSTPTKFDAKTFEKDHPALFEKYKTTTIQRTFLLKENKK